VSRAAALALLAAGCTLDARVALVSSDAGPDAGRDGGQEGGTVVSQFHLLPAGSPLPDEATCAARVHAAPEVRDGNRTPNHTVPTAPQLAGLAPWNSENAYDNRALGLEARITGSFTGTTDELLQWAACKWGFDEDDLRAEAVQSSRWQQTLAADWTTDDSICPPNADTRPTDGGVQCAATYGMFQVVWQYHKSSWPMLRDSTPFHLDYIFALRRVCFEGWDMSQAARATAGKPYTADDYWGCVGAHFSGGWYDDLATVYIGNVMGELEAKRWLRPGF
jgi:autotransporter family porin